MVTPSTPWRSAPLVRVKLFWTILLSRYPFFVCIFPFPLSVHFSIPQSTWYKLQIFVTAHESCKAVLGEVKDLMKYADRRKNALVLSRCVGRERVVMGARSSTVRAKEVMSCIWNGWFTPIHPAGTSDSTNKGSEANR